MTPDQIAQFEALVKLGEKAAQCTHPKRTPSRAAGSYDHDKAPVEFCDTCGATCYWGEPTPVDDSHLLVEVQAPVLAQLLAAWRRADTEIAALRTKLAELERERDEAHKALDACARNLGNGANTDGASHEFKLIVPTEVKLVVEQLERRAQAAEADCAALREHLKPLMDAPGCAWCGSPAMAYISFGHGEQQGMCCPQCMTYFEREDRAFKVLESVALPDLTALRAALAAMTPDATITREDA